MRLQLYMSPVLSDRLCKEAYDKQIEPRELADQILKNYFGIIEDEDDYQTSLGRVIQEVDEFLEDQKVKKDKDTFILLDFESFRSIGIPAMRSAVGRGVAKYLKERKEVEYCRDSKGDICRTNSHAAIYRIVCDLDD